MKDKNNSTFQSIAFVILVILIFLTWFEVYHLSKSLEENKIEVIVKHTYLINGKEHNTIHYLNNHSYTIDKPFTCDNKTYYSIYEDYKLNCLGVSQDD